MKNSGQKNYSYYIKNIFIFIISFKNISIIDKKITYFQIEQPNLPNKNIFQLYKSKKNSIKKSFQINQKIYKILIGIQIAILAKSILFLF